MTTHLRNMMMAPALMFLAGCANFIQGNGEYAEEVRHVEPFSELSVDGKAEIEFIVDPSVTGSILLTVSGDSNLLTHFVTSVRDGQLRIGPENWTWLDSEIGLKVRATVPEQTRMDLSGSVFLSIVNIDTSNLEIDASGSSYLDLQGAVGTLECDVSGSSRIYARDLLADVVELNVSGSAYFEVCAEDRLDVDASGSTSIYYYCEPREVSSNVSGSATVLPVSDGEPSN